MKEHYRIYQDGSYNVYHYAADTGRESVVSAGHDLYVDAYEVAVQLAQQNNLCLLAESIGDDDNYVVVFTP